MARTEIRFTYLELVSRCIISQGWQIRVPDAAIDRHAHTSIGMLAAWASRSKHTTSQSLTLGGPLLAHGHTCRIDRVRERVGQLCQQHMPAAHSTSGRQARKREREKGLTSPAH
eukprot:scaffold44741_cov20-Tisochrysis_lutea.AAC.4